MTTKETEEVLSDKEEQEERKKAGIALAELIETFSKYNFRAQDLIVVYGNLGYAIGAGMEGYEGDEGPGVEELQQAYYTNPTVGVALMLQSLLITSWHSDIVNQQKDKSE